MTIVFIFSRLSLILTLVMVSCGVTKPSVKFEEDFEAGACYGVKKDSFVNTDVEICIQQVVFAAENKDFTEYIGTDTSIMIRPPHTRFVTSNFTFEDSIYFKDFEAFKLCKIEVAPRYVYFDKEDTGKSPYWNVSSIMIREELQMVNKSHDKNCENDHIRICNGDKFERLITPAGCGSGGVYLISMKLVERGYLSTWTRSVTAEFEVAIRKLHEELHGDAAFKISRGILKFLDLELGVLLDSNVKMINVGS